MLTQDQANQFEAQGFPLIEAYLGREMDDDEVRAAMAG